MSLFTIRVEHHFEPCPCSGRLEAKLNLIISNQEKIMAKVEETAARLSEKLDETIATMGKVKDEVTKVNNGLADATAEVAALRTQLESGEMTEGQALALAAVEARIDSLKTLATGVDELIPDAPPTE